MVAWFAERVARHPTAGAGCSNDRSRASGTTKCRIMRAVL